MKYYKTSTNELYALELDGSQDHLITEDMIRISKWEADQTAEMRSSVTWDDVKKYRNKLLMESDWTDLQNSPVSNRPAWITYRQRLRDITKDFKSPDQVTWPQPPL